MHQLYMADVWKCTAYLKLRLINCHLYFSLKVGYKNVTRNCFCGITGTLTLKADDLNFYTDHILKLTFIKIEVGPICLGQG